MASSIKVKEWSKIRAKDNFARWTKVKAMADAAGVDARELAKSLIRADKAHGFRLASNESEATKRPEHFCGPTNLEYEETILINAVVFTTTRYQGRLKGHARAEHETFSAAMADASTDRQALIYATAASGRYACLGRAQWEWFGVLWYVFRS